MISMNNAAVDQNCVLATEFAGELDEFTVFGQSAIQIRVQPPPVAGSRFAGETSDSELSQDDDEVDSGNVSETFGGSPKIPKIDPHHLARRRSSVKCSSFAQKTLNPIRKIVDVMSVAPNPEKPLIKLHLGDPTVTGTLPPHPVVTNAVVESLTSGKYNGYGPSVGFHETRAAIAEYASQDSYEVAIDDVIVTSGCSHALQMAIESIGDPGMNMLIPNPGFPLYTTLMTPLGLMPRMYNLDPDQGWKVDLESLESQIDSQTAAIIVCNPSNPAGAVYSKDHLAEILAVAEKHDLPVIADEIYGDMVYNGAEFYPMATLGHKVPIITCDGLSKRWLVPGWRLGWLIINDHCDAFVDVRTGLQQLSQKIVGPSALIQGAVPKILKETPEDFFQNTRDVLSKNAKTVVDRLSNLKGVKPIESYGAMYLMLVLDMSCFPAFSTEMDMVQALISEESLYCLPGTCFGFSGALRLVLTYPNEDMIEACDRIVAFVRRYYREPSLIQMLKRTRIETSCSPCSSIEEEPMAPAILSTDDCFE